MLLLALSGCTPNVVDEPIPTPTAVPTASPIDLDCQQLELTAANRLVDSPYVILLDVFWGPNFFGAKARAKFSGGADIVFDGNGVPLPLPPQGLLAEFGDFDRDGELDLLRVGDWANPGASLVTGPLNTASPWVPMEIETAYDSVYCGDIDGDGLDDRCGAGGIDRGPIDDVMDLQYTGGSWGTYNVDFGTGPRLVLHGPGGLSLLPPIAHAPPVVPPAEAPVVPAAEIQVYNAVSIQHLQVLDVDGDGDQELLVFPGGRVVDEAVFAGAPEGRWRDGNPSWGTSGDFNGDGRIEHAVQTSPNTVEIQTAAGVVLRTFTSEHDLRGGLAGDPNGDGIDDLVLYQNGGSETRLWHFPVPLCP